MTQRTDIGLLILRISVGFLMLLHGLSKLSGISFIEGMMSNIGLPTFFAYGVYLTEIIAPLFMIIGFRTRLASLVFSLGALTAILLAHSADIFALSKYGGWKVELLGLYLFGSIALFFLGGGKISVSSTHKWD